MAKKTYSPSTKHFIAELNAEIVNETEHKSNTYMEKLNLKNENRIEAETKKWRQNQKTKVRRILSQKEGNETEIKLAKLHKKIT